MVDLANKAFCYYLDESMRNAKDEFVPCVIVENEPGYHPTDWTWGKDIEIARQCVREKNEKLGVTPKRMLEIVDSSMRESFLKDRIMKAKRKTLPTLIGLPKSDEVAALLEERMRS